MVPETLNNSAVSAIPPTVRRSRKPQLRVVQPATATAPASALDRLDEVLRQHFHQPDTQAIRVVMSTIKSHYLNLGDPAWIFVVAPPGSGKTTTTIMGAAGLPQVQILGSWSASTFLSGMHGAQQPGLLEKLGPTVENNKCFVTKGDGILISKDFTTVLAMQRDRRAEILSQLREIHDGQYRKDFGTGVTKIWAGRITMIAAVTPALDRAYSMSSTLGERFLQVRWHRPARIAGARAIDQQTAEKQISKDLTNAVRAVFDEASPEVPEIADSTRDNLAAVADLVAIARTYVYRSSFGAREIEDVPEPEANTRVAKGLAAIARGAAALRGTPTVTDSILRDVYRVALDCIPPMRREVLLTVLDGSPIPAGTTIARAVEDLQELGLLERDAPALSPLAVELVQESRLQEVIGMPTPVA
jgi:hypothetical protein